ncbi:hypothetical protein AB0395_05720 [Streptosporangium sp. NPDC051023]|uniref:hypothetical protein n=1 Tax=Streptosporangium sp. NPDC051023 TaxID=3155410 RepID=UPI00344CE4AC
MRASPGSYSGPCPASVTFSADVAVRGAPTVRYRWVRGDGTRGPVTTVKAGAKVVRLKERRTFSGTARGWQAVQVLSPVKLTSRRADFSVSCEGQKDIQGRKPSTGDRRGPKASAHVTVDGYSGPCTAPGRTLSFSGTFRVSRVPAAVSYRWVDSDGGAMDRQDLWFAAKDSPQRSVGVSRTFLASASGTRWIEILDRDGRVLDTSNRAPYSVTCTPTPVPATASVTGLKVTPAAFQGPCTAPVDVTFTADIAASKPTVVTYEWRRGDGTRVPGRWEFKDAGDLTRTVSLPWKTAPKGTSFPFDLTYRWRWADGGTWQQETVTITGPSAQRLLHSWYTSRSQAGRIFVDVLSPAQVRSEATEYSLTCDGRPPAPNTGGNVLSVTDPRITPSSHTGACPVNLKATATITVSAPTSQPVEYAWVFDNGTSSPVEKIDFPAGGPLTKTAVWDSWRAIKSSGPVTGYLEILSPNRAASDPVSYSVTCT